MCKRGKTETMGRRIETVKGAQPSGERRGIRLLALDVDGTLFRSDGTISEASIRAIRRAQEQGVHVVLASGRDYANLPLDRMAGIRMDYVIISNGGAAYRTADRVCMYEECMDGNRLAETLTYILGQQVYIRVIINGVAWTPVQCRDYVDQLSVPEHIRKLLKANRNWTDDIVSFVKQPDVRIPKVALNFQQLQNGVYLNREKVKRYLEAAGEYNLVSGGFSNLEFTRAGISKATGLRYLAEHLGIPMEQTMAMGDSENDREMIQAAGIGVAMDNALEHIKEAADVVTRTNDEDGVAYAIEQYILGV